jgi:hypothetical protein
MSDKEKQQRSFGYGGEPPGCWTTLVLFVLVLMAVLK